MCAGGFRELPCTGKEVRVNVRLGNCADAKAMCFREVDIAVDVSCGVDDDRIAGLLASEQPGGLGKILVVDLSKEHRVHSVRIRRLVVEPSGFMWAHEPRAPGRRFSRRAPCLLRGEDPPKLARTCSH